MGELVHVVHVGHQDGGDEEADGDAELEEKEKKNKLNTVVKGKERASKKEPQRKSLNHTMVTFFIYINCIFSCF